MTSKDFIYSISDPFPISDFVWNSIEEGSAGFFNLIVIIFHHSVKIFDIEYGDIRSTIELDEKYILKNFSFPQKIHIGEHQ